MSKKDYIILAGSFNNTIKKLDGLNLSPVDKKAGIMAVKIAVADLCYELVKDNSKFDSDRFLTACGIVER